MLLEYVKSIGVPIAGFTQTGYNSIALVCGFPYFSGYIEQANISAYAYGLDYHVILRTELGRIADFLRGHGIGGRIFADIGPQNEKEMFVAAGLGFYGVNSLAVCEKFGSYFFIGGIFLDKAIEIPDYPKSERRECLRCLRCVDACPGKAISLDRGFDKSRCASAITQKKGSLSADEIEIMKKSGSVWGCDICQKVCPHNDIKPKPMPQFMKKLSPVIDFESINERAYNYRGRAVLERNLEILKLTQ